MVCIQLVQDRSYTGFCEHGDERSGSIVGAKFLDQLIISLTKQALHHWVSTLVSSF
jgi:hypothetical protein